MGHAAAVAEFARPAGAAAFAPPEQDRRPPRHGIPDWPVPPGSREAFGPTASAPSGIDPGLGPRVGSAAPTVESPWWKADAYRDPWRDPHSDAWLGRPAVFAQGQLEQLDPDLDTEQDEHALVAMEPGEDKSTKTARGARDRLPRAGLLLALVVALVAGTLGGGTGYWLAHRADAALHNGDVKLAKVATAANRPLGSVANIAQRVLPSVVAIVVQTSTAEGIGSGVVIDQDGDILTNNHVISAAATDSGTIMVTFNDQSSVAAKIVGRDPTTDLAVIKVVSTALTVASLGDSSKLAVGDPVVAIGSPLGLQGTVTSGIVSALDRPVHVSGEASDTNAVIDAV